ncbi:MAG: hypothetical protein LBD95_07545 [Clostridiales Family XIII bacterium]|jgi:hypothetical protein|nr:hypothetical protein [Clostridiales Family XIII bacterium]
MDVEPQVGRVPDMKQRILFRTSKLIKVRGIVMGALYEDLRDGIGKRIDLLTEESLEQHGTKNRAPWFYEALLRERVKVYGQP